MDPTDRMREIGELIRTQDNRATSHPIFIVQEKKRIYGFDSDYTDNITWVHCDGFEADEEEASELYAQEEQDCVPDEWTKYGYIDQWEFVTACFTEQGAKDYIRANGHNLREPRIYAASAYRNREFIDVREFLKSLT